MVLIVQNKKMNSIEKLKEENQKLKEENQKMKEESKKRTADLVRFMDSVEIHSKGYEENQRKYYESLNESYNPFSFFINE